MKAFQFLKSGASFSRQRISKVDKLFKPKAEVDPLESKKDEVPTEAPIDKEEQQLIEIDEKLESNKAETLKAQHAQNLDKTKKLQTEFVHLLNCKKEMLLKLRKQYKIVLEGNNLESVPDLTPTWTRMASKLNFSPNFMRAVKAAGHTKPTPVQMQAVPVIMEQRDAIVLAETGSGKSLAFFAPLLEKIKRGSGLECFIVAPTRELTI